MITKEQLAEIRKSLTWGDQRYGRQQAKDAEDHQEMAAHSMYRAAKRLGYAGKSLDDFLDQVTVEDLTATLDEDRTPTSGTGTT